MAAYGATAASTAYFAARGHEERRSRQNITSRPVRSSSVPPRPAPDAAGQLTSPERGHRQRRTSHSSGRYRGNAQGGYRGDAQGGYRGDDRDRGSGAAWGENGAGVAVAGRERFSIGGFVSRSK
ncbi:hypothetical protein T492DRAFT_847432 [Pavlovales sp. CCMP2436]|nr:hypothetical protein T492DRAFT_847432 [Pavlovales sp. CCMP2436]